MQMRRRYRDTAVSSPEDLEPVAGWEIRKIHTGKIPGLILQNPDSGEKIKLILSETFFDGRMKISSATGNK